jgi:hypothetical protein
MNRAQQRSGRCINAGLSPRWEPLWLAVAVALPRALEHLVRVFG